MDGLMERELVKGVKFIAEKKLRKKWVCANSEDIYDIYTCCWPPTHFCTSHWCFGSSASSWDIYPSIWVVFFLDILHISRKCITFIAEILYIVLINLSVHIWLMLQKFLILPGHIPEHQSCLFQIFQTIPQHVLHLAFWFQIFWTLDASFLCAHSADAPEVLHFFQDIYLSTRAFFVDILDTPRICITFGILMLDILDIQHLIYLCTFCWCFGSLCTSSWCSDSSTFSRTFPWEPWLVFSDILKIHGHVLHLYMGGHILFWTFSPQFICTLTTDASQVPHFPGKFTQTPALCFLWIFHAFQGHVFLGHLHGHQGYFYFRYSTHLWQMYYIFTWHFGISTNHPQVFPHVNSMV